jgi:hypothetical protein
LGISSDPDLGVEIRRQPGASEVKGVVGSHEDDFGEDPSFDSDIEAGSPEFFLEAEDSVEGVVSIGVGLLKGEREDLHLGPLPLLDADLLSRNQPGGVSESAKHPPADIVDDALKGDGVTLPAEVGASLVSGVGGKEGAVGGDDLVGEKPQELNDPYQDMEDTVVEVFSQPGLEVGEGCLAGNVNVADTCIDPIVFSPDRIMEQVAEGFEIAELFEVAEELEEKEADRVIGHTHHAVLMGHNGTNEGELDKGRDHAGEAPDDPSGRIDLYVSALVSQASPLLKVKDSVVPQYSLDCSLVKRDIKNLPDLLGNTGTGEAVLGPLVNHETDDFGSDFIGFGFSPWLVDQSGEPLCAERFEGLVEGFSGVAELSACAADESLLVAMGPEHFIFDLGRIARIKKGGALKQI